MQTIAEPLVLRNVNRWKVDRYAPHPDDDVPWVGIDLCFLHTDGACYAAKSIAISSNGQCDIITKKATPLSVLDLLQPGTVNIAGAYAAITAANDNTAGNRATKKLAVEAALIAQGIIFT